MSLWLPNAFRHTSCQGVNSCQASILSLSKDAARLHGQLELRHADRTGLVVDLQGRLSPVYNRFQPDFERMWTGREAVLRLGETVNTLALEQSRDKLRYGWFDARPRLGRQSRSRLKRGLGLN